MHCSTVSHTVVCDPSVRCDTRVKDYFKDTTLTNTQFEETIARWRVRKSASLSHFMVTSADTNGTLCWPSQHVAALLRFDEEINFEEDTKRLRNTSAFRSLLIKMRVWGRHNDISQSPFNQKWPTCDCEKKRRSSPSQRAVPARWPAPPSLRVRWLELCSRP